MVSPKDVKNAALLKADENLKFRSFLKMRAKEEELDNHFTKLHKELFSSYDCTKCSNCCEEYQCLFENEEEIEKAAAKVLIAKEEFIKKYLELDDSNYRTKEKPCKFLNAEGSCILGEYKPIGCVEFPYTNKPERLWHLYSMLEAVEVCPVAFEIWERLKQIYGFKTKK